MTVRVDELEEERVRVEQLIAKLLLADAFIEDLVHLESYRKALVATISLSQAERKKPITKLEVWRRTGRNLEIQTERVFKGALEAATPGTMSQDNDRAVFAQNAPQDVQDGKATATPGSAVKALWPRR